MTSSLKIDEEFSKSELEYFRKHYNKEEIKRIEIVLGLSRLIEYISKKEKFNVLESLNLGSYQINILISKLVKIFSKDKKLRKLKTFRLKYSYIKHKLGNEWNFHEISCIIKGLEGYRKKHEKR